MRVYWTEITRLASALLYHFVENVSHNASSKLDGPGTMTYSHSWHLSPPLYLPHTSHHQQSNLSRQALPDIISVVEGTSRLLAAHTQPSNIYRTSSPSPLTPISCVLSANSQALDIYDTSHLVHVSHAREITSPRSAMGTEGATSQVVLNSHTEPLEIHDAPPLAPPPHISRAPQIAVGMVERGTGGRRTVSVTAGRESRLKDIKEVSLELSESSGTENEVRESAVPISVTGPNYSAAKIIGPSRESGTDNIGLSRKSETKEIGLREFDIEENRPIDTLRRKIGQRELGIRSTVLGNVRGREREVKETDIDFREVGSRETKIRDVGQKESFFLHKRNPGAWVREGKDYTNNSTVLRSRWQIVDGSNENTLEKSDNKEKFRTDNPTRDRVGGLRDGSSFGRIGHRMDASPAERIGSPGENNARERRGWRREQDTSTERIGGLGGNDYSSTDRKRWQREEKSDTTLGRGKNRSTESMEGRRNVHFSERLGGHGEKIGERKGTADWIGSWKDEEQFGERKEEHRTWTRAGVGRDGRSRMREDREGNRRKRWGEESGGVGENEHRFCCAVARMRLIIHLQTLLRGTVGPCTNSQVLEVTVL